MYVTQHILPLAWWYFYNQYNDITGASNDNDNDKNRVYLTLRLSHYQQGKSEGFESCDRPIVRKRPIWVKISDVLSRVTLKFDG